MFEKQEFLVLFFERTYLSFDHTDMISCDDNCNLQCFDFFANFLKMSNVRLSAGTEFPFFPWKTDAAGFLTFLQQPPKVGETLIFSTNYMSFSEISGAFLQSIEFFLKILEK